MKKATTNAARLRALMKRKKLTRSAVAELADVARVTVDSWLAPDGASSFRRMPDRALRLIELSVGAQRRKS